MIITQTLIYPIFSSLDIITRITPVDDHKTDITVYIYMQLILSIMVKLYV